MLRLDDALIIDWTQMPTYNTIMSVAAGAALLNIVWMGRLILKGHPLHLIGHAVTFLVLGTVLTTTGLHMTLTWPFAKYFPFDNIIFGEPSLAFGVLLLGGAILLWVADRRRQKESAVADPGPALTASIAPLNIFIFGMGLALGAIAMAGLVFQLFAAPAEEPITGAFAEWPWMEAIFMSGMFGFVGLGAVFFPFALRGLEKRDRPTVWHQLVAITLGLSGLGFLLFGALNFFTHVGLIINTMGPIG